MVCSEAALGVGGVCEQVQLLHVDAALGPVSVMFSGAREPIAAAGTTAVFGRVAVARQVTAPPALYSRELTVGRLRTVEISVPRRISILRFTFSSDLDPARRPF